jgi:AraC-like DNA-binding protein
MTGLNVLPPPRLRRFVRGIQYIDFPPSEDGFVIPAQVRSTLLLPEHTEYTLDGDIADRVSLEAATLLGPHDTPIVNRTSRPVRGFTVDFTPLGAVELLGVPQGELANRGVAADQLLPKPWVRELVERVNGATDLPTALRAIYDLLRSVPPPDSAHEGTTLVRRALAEGAVTPTAGDGGVRTIAERLGITPRHVNREFHRHFGMGPRRYALIRRIQTAMTAIAEGRAGSLSELALDTGFFDYSHFSHEFKRSAMSTPKTFSTSRRYREYQVVAATPRII